MMEKRPTFLSGFRGLNRSYGQSYWNNGMAFGHLGDNGYDYGGEYGAVDVGNVSSGSTGSWANTFSAIFNPAAKFVTNIVALRTPGSQYQASPGGTFVGGSPLLSSPGSGSGTLLLLGGGLVLVLLLSKGGRS